MKCDQTGRDQLHAFADGELSEADERHWEAHLRECAECRGELERLRALREAIRGQLPLREPPRQLRDQVRRTVRAEQGRRAAARPQRGAWLALAATLVVAASAGSWMLGRDAATRDTLAADIVAAHLRSLQLEHLVDIASSEHHVVKPWFAGKLEFSPPVPDLAAEGYPLLGARLDFVAGQQVAALVYGRREHRVNLFVWPGAAGCSEDGALVRRGINVVHGRAAGMELWAVSDLTSAELSDLMRRWEQAATDGGCR